MIATATDEFFTGAVGVFVGLLLLSLAICWLIFPVVVVSKFNQLLKAEREANRARAELAKAVQWMLDNWKS